MSEVEQGVKYYCAAQLLLEIAEGFFDVIAEDAGQISVLHYIRCTRFSSVTSALNRHSTKISTEVMTVCLASEASSVLALESISYNCKRRVHRIRRDVNNSIQMRKYSRITYAHTHTHKDNFIS
jgi:hypothetical protein